MKSAEYTDKFALTLENESLRGSVADLTETLASKIKEHFQEMVTVKNEFQSQLVTIKEDSKEGS